MIVKLVTGYFTLCTYSTQMRRENTHNMPITPYMLLFFNTLYMLFCFIVFSVRVVYSRYRADKHLGANLSECNRERVCKRYAQ